MTVINPSLHKFIEEYKKNVNLFPGIVTVTDLNHSIVLANDKALVPIGFKKTDALIYIPYHEMKCKAAESHEDFEAQDKLCLTKNQKIAFLSCHEYSDGWKLCLGEKSIIFDENKTPIGLFCYVMDITNQNLIDITRYMFHSTKKIDKSIRKKFCYLIENENLNAEQFSNRQLECIFFLLRGKSNKEMAKILSLSSRTVESYLEDIKNKLKCNTKSDLIEKLIIDGYMNILPESLIKNHGHV